MSSNSKLIAVVLTKNEAAHIGGCIASLHSWVDHVVVWDSGSTDATCRIARYFGAHVIARPFDNYAAQRQAALDSINAEWILFVDADERATPALAYEIRGLLRRANAHSAAPAGYWIPRRNFIVGREIRHGGYYPDYQMRLVQPKKARYAPDRAVHEIVHLDGKEGYLYEPLLHFNYSSWGQFHDKQRSYAIYEANILHNKGIRPRPHNFILQPLREWYRRFITLHGWLDGRAGIRLALLYAWYYGFVPYWQLVQLQMR